MKLKTIPLCLGLIALFVCGTFAKSFVKVQNQQFMIDGKPYYFIGTNYWYGSYLGLKKNKKRGIKRLRKELDFLKKNGVTNLRVIAGAEGSGLINGVTRVGPPLQIEQGKFDEKVLDGLDILLYEMGKRDLKAVIFFSNNWEWSGGFQQYLNWNDRVPNDKKTRKLTWDELRDTVAEFYSCDPCKEAYNKQLEFVMNRTNKITKQKYTEDPTIMAWQLANEPRPMRPFANEDYKKWVADVAALIKSKDKNHLVSIGHEGRIGTESMQIFEEIHDDKNVDYLTMHIWARNWGWYQRPKIEEGFEGVLEKAKSYIEEHVAVAKKQNKPLVIEEFGFARDGEAFDAVTSTLFRDKYFDFIFSYLPNGKRYKGALNGVNFWAFGGKARPIKNQLFWKKGDDYMGDPPMEEQGLYTVFDQDKSTWKVIKKYSKSLR